MRWLLLATVAALVGSALLLRWRRPAWYWMTFGALCAMAKVRLRYASVMDACDLTVAASRFRLTLARWFGWETPMQRVPRLLWIKPTRTGLRLRIRMRPGQDAFDYSAAVDRLRHAFGVHQVTSREIKPGTIEIAMTGYDVLKRVQMPARVDRGMLRVPVALCEDGSVHYRDYREVPHSITLGAVGSGKSVTQRRVIRELAAQRVALVGIDCKNGVELAPLARRFSALADNADDAADLLEALVARMETIYQVIRREQRISADTPDAEITADIWGLPEHLRPVPVVLTIDEIAELALFTTAREKKRRERAVVALVRLAQLGRAAGIFLDIYGQRFGSELGDGITMLRAQLTGRTSHRVNDESSAKMAFGDISPHAVFAATQIRNDRPGMAVVGYSNGEWRRIRSAYTSMREAVSACNKHADLTPDLPELARFRPLVDVTPVEAPAMAEAA
ncbi:FtsK/SpoIIIE domain-containing protein [Streptomyces sp. SLBN-31]|uniref:FtsK/SpoIIIE domain-containing protein n=1 Tax=Streptomyces sp. SLBN-31 TaxID=2768444 RepID=UPI00114ED95A|nr:FtsK/SpoIIIE domain-containing protein [Streptomyces sp. SLBN-31]TQJ90004.1 S-DNA-T family DNA segregation ATPase FtsK/SpoIIIE [Streptomyces sp. SLBN-31]